MLNENDFLGYMSYSQNLEDIIDMCVAAAREGEDHITLESMYDISEEDIEYIEREVSRRL